MNFILEHNIELRKNILIHLLSYVVKKYILARIEKF